MAYDRNLVADEPPEDIYGDFSEAELDAAELEILDLMEEFDVQLTDQGADSVFTMAHTELGGDVRTAFRVVAQRAEDAHAAYEQHLSEGVKELEKTQGRTITQPEIDQLRAHLDPTEDARPDLNRAWKELHGLSYSAEQIAAVEQGHKDKLAELREEGYSTEFIDAYNREHTPKVNEKIEKMKRSGKGHYNLDDERDARDYASIKLRELDEADEAARAEKADATLEELPLDATHGERRDYASRRFSELEQAQEAETETETAAEGVAE